MTCARGNDSSAGFGSAIENKVDDAERRNVPELPLSYLRIRADIYLRIGEIEGAPIIDNIVRRIKRRSGGKRHTHSRIYAQDAAYYGTYSGIKVRDGFDSGFLGMTRRKNCAKRG